MPVSFTLPSQDMTPYRWGFLSIWILSLIPIDIPNTAGRSDIGRASGIDSKRAGRGSNGQHDAVSYGYFIRMLFFIIGLVVVLPLSISTAQAGTVALSWNASSGASGYRVYYGKTSGNYTSNTPAAPSLITTTTYMTPDLAAGTYYFAIKAFDSAGNSSAYSNEVKATIAATVAAPKAIFSASPTSGTAPVTVNFTNSSTNATTWFWEFGDGTTSTAKTPSKTYSSAGTYTVKLTATGSGGSDAVTKSNLIFVVSSTAAAPVANFSATPTSGTTATTFSLANTSTGNATSWSWNFGDGTSSTAKTALKTYSKPGTYTVRLTATGPGGSNTATKINYISVSAAPPIANFTATPTSGAAPLSTKFTNTSTGVITSYAWSFGDGSTSTASNPTYMYSKAGTYTVKLTTTGPAGSNTKTQTGYIKVAAASTSTGLVAAYNFEEASGTTVFDASGKGNHGTISGATRSQWGKFGSTLYFDGTNDWVTINDSASLDLAAGMTLEAWIFPTDTMDDWRCVLLKERDGGQAYSLLANSSSNQPSAVVRIGNVDHILPGGPRLTPRSWAHLAVTYDGVTERLYINGNQVSSKTLSGSIQASNGVLRIGGNSIQGNFFKGQIDEVRIYNRALTASEIQADMNTTIQ